MSYAPGPGKSGSVTRLKSRLETTLKDSWRLRASLVRGASRLVWIRLSYAFGTSILKNFIKNKIKIRKKNRIKKLPYAVGPGVSYKVN